MSGPHRLGLNESAYPPLPAVADALRRWVGQAHRYPEFLPNELRALVAEHVALQGDQVSIGAGATGLIGQVISAVLSRSGQPVATAGSASAAGLSPTMVTSVPTFDGYPILAALAGMEVVSVPLRADGCQDVDALLGAIDSRCRLLALCSPHNPTGTVLTDAELARVLDSVPADVVVILDEAYIEYAEHRPDTAELIDRYPNLVVVRTFSKAYGLAGLRVGYAMGSGSVIEAVRAQEMPFGVGSAAAVAVPVALAARAELAERVRAMRVQRERLRSMLSSIGMTTAPSQANCLLLPGTDGQALGETLRSCGVETRDYGAAGRRITVGDAASVDFVIAALRAVALSA